MAVVHCLAFAGYSLGCRLNLLLFVSYSVVHKRLLFLLCFGFWPASWKNSNLKGKGGKSLSIENKNFPYGNSYSPHTKTIHWL